MKSKVIITALCVAVALIFFGCGKDGEGNGEGEVYNPSQKISKTYDSSTYSQEKVLDEIWEWNDKTLAAIYFDEDKSEGFKFEYNENSLVTKISYIYRDEVIYLNYTYNGKEIEKVEYCGKVEGIEIIGYRLTYEYKNSKIVKISLFENKSVSFAPKKAKKKLLSLVLPKKMIERLPSNIVAKADGGFIKWADMEWTWENDNITKVKRIEYNEDGSFDTYNFSYQYDNKNSPFYNFTFGMWVFEYAYLPSKNNIIREQGQGRGMINDSNYTTNYTISYEIKYNDKNYPTEVAEKNPYDPESTWTNYYEYK